MKISDIVNIENSFITLLARYKGRADAHLIVYKDPVKNMPIQLFSDEFAYMFKMLVSDFRIGFATGAIVGLARERTPADIWRSDTIERSMQDKNSMYQGILRIVTEEDGIPVFVQATSTVGNIAPALGYLHRGNPLAIHKALERYNLIQKSIVARILEGKPEYVHQDTLIAAPSVGDGFKAENRLNSIRKKMDSLHIEN